MKTFKELQEVLRDKRSLKKYLDKSTTSKYRAQNVANHMNKAVKGAKRALGHVQGAGGDAVSKYLQPAADAANADNVATKRKRDAGLKIARKRLRGLDAASKARKQAKAQRAGEKVKSSLGIPSIKG